MERIALGYLQLSAAEFEALTPRELTWRYDAELARENRAFERLAQLACWVINPWRGQNAKPMKASDLLRRGPSKSVEWWNEDD